MPVFIAITIPAMRQRGDRPLLECNFQLHWSASSSLPASSSITGTPMVPKTAFDAGEIKYIATVEERCCQVGLQTRVQALRPSTGHAITLSRQTSSTTRDADVLSRRYSWVYFVCKCGGGGIATFHGLRTKDISRGSILQSRSRFVFPRPRALKTRKWVRSI
jgi:hypothetical protein